MIVVGISAFYHDSAAALIRDGEIVAAAQEERFTRKKHDAGFPTNAVNYCLAQGNLKLSEVDHIAFYDKPAANQHLGNDSRGDDGQIQKSSSSRVDLR